MSPQPQPRLTFEEYLELEEHTGIKHEDYRGQVYAMSAASARHNLIVANIIASLHGQLRDKPCTVYPSDLRLKVDATGRYSDHDISVICGPVRLDPERPDTILNPTVSIEILSPSTGSIARGKKSQHYRAIETLQEYLLIDQDSSHVEQYIKHDKHQWLLNTFNTKHHVLQLRSIQATLTIADIYEKVTFEEENNENRGAAARVAWPSLIAGAVAGLVGLLVFLAVHAMWILPIWGILPFGTVAAAAAGTGVGWAYHYVGPRLGNPVGGALGIAAIMLAATAPAQVGAWLRPPIRSSQDFDAVFGALEISWVVAELTVAAFVVAGLAGWLLLRERRGVLATAVAGAGFALTAGHNVPFIGNSPGAGTMWTVMGAFILASAVTLALVDAWMRKSRPSPASA